ncbi:hypothetical protein Xcel_1808 [Xylanimonas cellulosilytica DSM 15894]|uniref:Uncharacterized protein n=1 Tax=Xylanimonas cellulosilytica (strain DSM 15894 / JCM 12276 / CECT 5975 / KCTC 9989 / LMG 20990 / NBRC 107835 / XIL07) TaxID=446471 RepID=D1BSY6_XYLCX|nr:hypothetical protein [Xylanimonas cellulosilytica]ACZ30828.1 hypothetical protein Xcel_1808 [Xylanimonas cellulosilytica DSM 15894]
MKHLSYDLAPHGVSACPDLGAQRRFDLHRTDLIDHSCGPHLG